MKPLFLVIHLSRYSDIYLFSSSGELCNENTYFGKHLAENWGNKCPIPVATYNFSVTIPVLQVYRFLIGVRRVHQTIL